MGIMAVLFLNVVTVNMLMSLFFASGASAVCLEDVALLVTAPQEMEALSGACLQIPCSFAATVKLNSKGPTYGVWFRNDPRLFRNNVIFNSSGTNNTYPLSLTGNLSQKNCTTLFSNLVRDYTNTYFFRIESWPFKATAFCNPLQITVKDSPPKPRIEISGDLKEKESVTITCSAPTPCPHSPPQLTWNLQQHPHNIMEQNTDQTFTTKIQETITLSDQHDGYSITCSARYPVNGGEEKTAEETKTLNVSYSPRVTSVVMSPSGPVSVGSLVNLTCSCRGNPPVVHFVWFTVSNGRLKLIIVDTQVYRFKVTDGDRGRFFYCGCRNDLDIQFSPQHQLTFKGDQQSQVFGAEVTVKILGIIMLVGTVVIFECWLRSRHYTKPVKQDGAEAVCVDAVTETTA